MLLRVLPFFLLFIVGSMTIVDGLTGHPTIAPPITSPFTFTALTLLALTAFGVFLARTISPRAAIYALLILATTPEWFTTARTNASPTNAFILVGISLVGIGAFDPSAPRLLRIALFVITAAVTLKLALPILGATKITSAPVTSPSFTSTLVARIAYGLAPWSALLPFALLSRGRQPAVRHAIFLALVLVLAASVLFQSTTTLAVGLIAASIAIWLDDLDDNNKKERALPVVVGVGSLSLGLILARDLALGPDRVLDVLATTPSSLPSGHSLATARMLRFDILALTAATFVLAVLRPSFLAIPRRGMIIVAVGFIAGAILREGSYPNLIRHAGDHRLSFGRLEVR